LEGTLVDALSADGRPLAERAGEGRAGIVHRLDRDVSGLLIVAKTDEAHERLVAAMQARDIDRRYLALVGGTPQTDRGKIDAPIGRHPRHRTRMAVLADGRPAVTWFSVKERFAQCALLEVKLETGRTHQIRTHLASIRLPVVGDAAYGRDPALARKLGLRRPFLHAYRLGFAHPVTGEALSFESRLPDELASVLEVVRA
jgi:23S rRNA pseudouridine1911/1915/1917 synthase